jgi:nicotinate-nucleotide pyrophosphorylase (carboxylating)
MVESIVEAALKEDIGTGDITTNLTVRDETLVLGVMVAKQAGIIAGGPVAALVFQTLDSGTRFEQMIEDGCPLEEGSVIAQVKGKARSCLTAERVALNFVQRLSGIATLTRKYVDRVEETGATILDTRKTTPTLRYLEKYAVRMGGGENHRFTLGEMILLKDNHIDAAGGITAAVRRIHNHGTDCAIEVETRNLAEVEEALKAGVDRIMLDNMQVDVMEEAVELIDHAVEVEVSGNVSLDNVRAIAEIGVDYISVGSLTHSAPALDVNLQFREIV